MHPLPEHNHPARSPTSPGALARDRFLLEREVASGPTGTVWAAHDRVLGRAVTLRVLAPAACADAEAVARLAGAVRRQLVWSHPNVAALYDLVEWESGGLALVMDPWSGISLEERLRGLRRPAFEVGEIRRWVGELLDVLAYAHGSARVVHGGLRLAALRVTAAGALLVSEFGVNRALAPGEPTISDDIHAVGAVLFELLAGAPPPAAVRAGGEGGFSVNAFRAATRPGSGSIPAPWDRAIAACLAPEADERPASIEELRGRLSLPVEGNGPAVVGERVSEVATDAQFPWRWCWIGCAGVLFVGALALYRGRAARTVAGAQNPPAAAVVPHVAPAPQVASAEPTGAERRPGPAVKRLAAGPYQVVGTDLVLEWLAPGTFTAGSARDGLVDPLPQITIADGFWLARTEVTEGQWRTVMNAERRTSRGPTFPVVGVSFLEALEFCRVLNDRERGAGRIGAEHRFTLPTEAQWEYACRAGTDTEYAGPVEALGWCALNSGNTLHRVATKRANAWGLFDLHGNAAEWCFDVYTEPTVFGTAEPVHSFRGHERVVRGGHYAASASHCRSAARQSENELAFAATLGFRVVLVAEAGAAVSAAAAPPARRTPPSPTSQP